MNACIYIHQNHQKAPNKTKNFRHKRDKLTTYVTTTDSVKTKNLECCVACQKKHLLGKCESNMEKPFDWQNQNIIERNCRGWMFFLKSLKWKVRIKWHCASLEI